MTRVGDELDVHELLAAILVPEGISIKNGPIAGDDVSDVFLIIDTLGTIIVSDPAPPIAMSKEILSRLAAFAPLGSILIKNPQ